MWKGIGTPLAIVGDQSSPKLTPTLFVSLPYARKRSLDEDLFLRRSSARLPSTSHAHKNEPSSWDNYLCSVKIYIGQNNLYKIEPSNYNKIIKNKLLTPTNLIDVTLDQKLMMTSLNFLVNLTKKTEWEKWMKNAYILFENHKRIFFGKKQCRLINPLITELDIVLKKILSKILYRILKNKSNYILWRNSYDTMKWFKNINNKRNFTFVQFDIMDFYPSFS